MLVHGIRKIVPTIEIGGHCIYKSNFVLQLNGNIVLSKDRLARIQHNIQFNNHDNCLRARSSSRFGLLSIGLAYEVHFMQRNTTRLLSTMINATKRKRGRLTNANRVGNATDI